MLKVKKQSREVLYCKNNFITLNKNNLKKLLFLAKKNKKKIIRLCTHNSRKDKVHQMFIVHPKNYFVVPHMHIQGESMSILKGIVDVVIFNKKGKISKIIEMGEPSSNKVFYYKLPKKIIHTFIIKSNVLVFYEVTEGPFKKQNMAYPKWAPNNKQEVKKFQKQIKSEVLKFKKNDQRSKKDK